MKMETKQTAWNPIKALVNAQRSVDELNVPPFQTNLTEREDLEFANLMNYDNRKLEEFLIAYGGYRAYLEAHVADSEAKKKALEAAFDEGYSTAIYRIATEREEAGQKKFTREEIRGAALSTYESLKELRQEVIEQTAMQQKIGGLLNAYKAAYDAVSRIVTLRTFGESRNGG